MKRSMILVLLFAIASIAYSQAQESPDTTKTYKLEGITVEGIRADAKTPVSQKTVSTVELNKINFGQEPNLLLTKLPAFTAYSDAGSYSNYSYIRLRGIDQTRINMTLDGAPLNDPEDQGVYFANFTNFLQSTSDVQVQRGVGTSTNGVASFAGSMNFNSVALTDRGGDVQYGIGSFNSNRFTIGYSTGLTKEVAFYTRYSNSKSDGYKYHSGNQSYSWFFGGGWFGETDAVKVFGFIGSTKDGLAYAAVPMADILRDPRTNIVSPLESDDFRQNFVQVQYLKQYDDKFSMNASVYYSHLNGWFTWDGTSYELPVFNYKLQSDLYGGLVNYNAVFDNTSLHFGIHVNTYRRDHSMNYLGDKFDQYFNSGYKSEESIFLKGTQKIDKLSVFADMQFRGVNFKYVPQKENGTGERSVNWMFFNPRIGVTYAISNYTDYYASVGMTGREPTRLDMFAGGDYIDSTNVSELGDLSRVKPEYNVDFEFGVNYHNENLSYKLNGYAMKFRNEIAAVGPMGALGLPLRKNVESSYRLGIEFDGTYKFGRFTLTNNSSFNHSKILKYVTDYNDAVHNNVTPLMTPTIISNTSVGYDGRILGLTLEGRYVSSAYIDNENTTMVPEYFVMDATLNVHFTDRILISLQYNNFTDKRYFTGGYVSDQPYYYTQAPANYYMTFKVGF